MRRLPSTPQTIQQRETEERARRIIEQKFRAFYVLMGITLICFVFFVFFNSDFWNDTKAKSNDLDCEVVFLDMEYGESIILECEEKLALIDCGTENHTDELLGYLDSNGIRKLDYYFVSGICEGYPDVFEKVLDSVEITSVILPSDEYENPLHDEIENLAFVNGKNAVVSNQGSAFNLHKISISVIEPRSLSLFLKFGNHSFVVWNSDDEENGNEIAISRPWIDADVLYLKDDVKAGKDFLETVTPQFCVVPGTRNADCDTAYLQSYAEKIYSTGTNGNIIIRSDEVDLEILENQ